MGIKINFDALSATSETATDTLLDEQDEENDEDVQEVKSFLLDTFDDEEGSDEEEKFELF